MNDWQIIWFILVGFFLTGYAVLDGFDLGAGFWYPFAKREERRIILDAIKPVWDGNEVWLLAGGAVIFAAFPHFYATVFSGFYPALIIVIFALIFRAVSIEFIGKSEAGAWQRLWDFLFAVGSIVPAILFGVATGNILRGIKLDAGMNYTGGFLDLLNPFSLLMGIFALAVFAAHGASYIVLKTQGDLKSKAVRWQSLANGAALISALAVSIAIVFTQSHLLKNYLERPLLILVPLGAVLMLALVFLLKRKGRHFPSFLCSALSIGGIMASLAVSIFPNVVFALGHPELNLNIVNASSSPLTLKVMLFIALLGMPLVIGYNIWIYKTFKGKLM